MRDSGRAQSQCCVAFEELVGENVTKDRAETEEIAGEECGQVWASVNAC